MIKFSLLICIYTKENLIYFKQCLDSINNSSVLPNEIVIVKDGPLTEELEKVISDHKFPDEVCLTIVALPVNVTLGPARAAGVEAAKHEWVAIMDTDDICRPDRFYKQLQMIKDDPRLGLIGGQIIEFSDDVNEVNNMIDEVITESIKNTVNESRIRTVPIDHDDIVNFVKKRNPFNHMTVMFRRDAVLAAGNYRLFPLFEDYDLWTRMIKNGTICANHPDVLVDARVDGNTYGRRRGFKYISSEWRMQKQLKSQSLINTAEFIRNILIRIPVRLLPGRALAGVYRRFIRDDKK